MDTHKASILDNQNVSKRNYHERPYVSEKRYDDQVVDSRNAVHSSNPYAVGTIHSPQRDGVGNVKIPSKLETIISGIGIGIFGAAVIAGAALYFNQNSKVMSELARTTPLSTIEEVSQVYQQFKESQIKMEGSMIYVDKNENGIFNERSDLKYILSPELLPKNK